MGRQPAGLLQRPGVSPDLSDNPVDDQPKLVLTVRQAARALDSNKQTIRNAVKRGEIKAGRLGKKILIFREEFCEQWHIPDDYDFGDP
jgi:excisionase family DNA binding protein